MPSSISAIIPAHNAARTLPAVLTALTSTDPPPLEIILVDDGSTDNTAQIASSFNVRLLSINPGVGAAAAKNRGAQAARGDILFFTDADIIVPPETFALLAEDYAVDQRDGVVGLLDQDISAQDWASQFKNLWMNFTYARLESASSLGLFYTSAASIRRDVFSKTGGFDENYHGASIAEDTEFGQRAWGQGIRLSLDPRLRVVHLKAYTVSGVLREDFRRARALTLMRLRKRGQPFYTSVPAFYQLAVPVIYISLFFLWLALILPHLLWLGIACVALILFYALNAPFIAFLARARGLGFAAKSMLFLPFDVLVVGLGILSALFDFVRGTRY